MKKGLIHILLVVFLISFIAATASSQEPAKSALDQEIETYEKKLLELKQRKREELQRQIKALQEELDRLGPGSTTSHVGEPPAPILSAGSVPHRSTTANPSQPANPSTADASGNGNNATVSVPNNDGAIGGQVDTKCMLVLQQPRNYAPADVALCGLADSIVERRILGVSPSGIDLTSDQGLLLPALLGQVSRKVTVDAAVKSFVLDIEASRADKQFGADAKSSGTTSLAVKGGIPTVLSWAVENGAAVSSSTGTTLTFRVNPVGFVEALSGLGYISGFRRTDNDPLINAFRRTSLGFSFDTTRGTSSPTFVGSKQQLSAVSFRYQFVNQRDPRHQRYQALWDEFFRNQGLAFTKLQSDRLKQLENETAEASFRNEDLKRWVEQTNTALNSTSISATQLTRIAATEEIRNILEQRLSALPTTELEKDPTVIKAISDFVGAYLPYLREKKKIMDGVAKGTLVTFEYTNYREPTAPDLSNFRFIAEKGTIGGFDITANGSLTFFNRRPTGANFKRIRDFDFSLQLDKKLDDVMGLGASTLSFTGKFQRLTSDAIAFDGTILPDVRGDIAAGQVKLMIPLKDTGLKIPFSLTFANRTELIREKEVRANFGFTFDLDTIFAKFKPF
ncbi:MAG: septum formation initiator family protein [Pyrinomonadaceae bacterium]